MPRTLEDSKLETKTARSKLPTGETVHWKSIDPGKLHLGYRRRPEEADGVWIVRRWVGKSPDCTNGYRKTTLKGMADDNEKANGSDVLSFADAQRRAHEVADQAAEQLAAVAASPSTVADVVKVYTDGRDRREAGRQGRAVRSDASQRLGRYVVGWKPAKVGGRKAIAPTPLAAVRLADLAEVDLKRWRAALPGSLRATTVRRLCSDLQAALTAGYEASRGDLPASLLTTIRYGLKAPATGDDDSETSSRDDQILTDAELARLLVAGREIDAEAGWDGDLWRMILVLTATGARFSQVVRLRVRDFQPDVGRLMVPVSRKGNRSRQKNATHVPVPVGADVVEALRPIVVGRAADAPLLERWRVAQVGPARWERTGRGRWLGASELTRPFRLIRAKASLPAAIPYSLRHTSIVRGIRANLPIRLVAATHDTSVGIIEKHYSKFIVTGLEDMLRAAIVPLVPAEKTGENVVSMEQRRAAT
ncbi:tyrosine-type recombinase/integrase [Mesorhizobium sp. M0757]|uniref:tyrosine-type recombinase/integrase n=1 Tax=Mesorhizobium sp. M0757 TaxID=2956993 RepID=UPI00333B74C8